MKHQCTEMLIFPGTNAIWACILSQIFLSQAKTSDTLTGMQEKVFRDFHQCLQIFSCIPDRNFLGNIVLHERV